MKRKTKITLLLFIPIILVLSYFIIGLFFYHFALDANATQSRTVGEKVYIPSAYINANRDNEERQKDRQFLETVQPITSTITSHDGLKLNGYQYIQQEQTDQWVFAVHGYTGSARQMTRWNRQLYELGYNVFVPDLRGHGQSEGDFYGMGWLDQPDLHQWLEKLINQFPEAKITLFGVSMGASSVLNLAATDLPTNVQSVIADSGFTSVAEIFETQLNETLHLPRFPIMNAANTVSKLRIDLDFYNASTVELVPSISLPILYIHGGQDNFVPVQNVYDLAAATTSPHEVWIVEEANHGEAIKVEPDLYPEKIHQFIQNNR